MNLAALDILNYEETPDAKKRRLCVAASVGNIEEFLLVANKRPLNPKSLKVIIVEYKKAKAT